MAFFAKLGLDAAIGTVPRGIVTWPFSKPDATEVEPFALTLQRYVLKIGLVKANRCLSHNKHAK